MRHAILPINALFAVAGAIGVIGAIGASGCGVLLGVEPCAHGEACPSGQACDTQMGVCRAATNGGGVVGEGEGGGGAGEGEGEVGGGGGEGEVGGGAGEGEGEGEGGGVVGEGEGEGDQVNTGEGEGEGDVIATVGPACGDGHIDPGEDCDDGNLVSGDRCSSTCKRDSLLPEVEFNDYPVTDSNIFQIEPGLIMFNGLPSTGNLTITGSIDQFTGATACGPAPSPDPCSDFDGFWLNVPLATVVRVETFTVDGADDCDGTDINTAFFDDQTTPENFSETHMIRQAIANGAGAHCSALTAALPAGRYWTDMTHADFQSAIPSYHQEIVALTDEGNELEPNDDPTRAERAVIDGHDVFMSGTVNRVDDVDVYAVRVPPGQGLRAEVIPVDPHTDCGVFNTRIAIENTGVTFGSVSGACPFIDGTGATPADAAAFNDGDIDKTLFIAVASGTSTGFTGALPYKVAFTVR